MSLPFSRSSQAKKEAPLYQPREGDPLLPPTTSTTSTRSRNSTVSETSGLRARRTASKSPSVRASDFGSTSLEETPTTLPLMRRTDLEGPADQEEDVAGDYEQQGFVAIHDEEGSSGRSSLQPGALPSITDDEGSGGGPCVKQEADLLNMGRYQRSARPPQDDSRSLDSNSQPPLLEIPEEIYAVRKAALKVMKPLTKTWIIVTVGFSLTVTFGMARWTRLLPVIPFWFILLPSWGAHVSLFWLHILSARELSTFIADANDSRQRPDSRDHLNRTEYLPLLQRSLKFGLKTGVLSFFVFCFEILVFIRLARRSITLTAAFIPLWLIVSGGIVDGLICKTQHFLRVLCWVLTFVAMVLLVLKIDYGHDEIRWRVVTSPVVAVLSIASGSLIYIIYGHQVGFYRMTEAQLTAGNLYSLAALITIILLVMTGEVIPLARPVEMETRLFVVILAPLVVCLVGMGAWVVSRDEFGRLLLYGGQAAVHPKMLRWDAKGWKGVQGKGVTVIPMFGEVTFRPLEKKRPGGSVELCTTCCAGGCYPFEEEEEDEEGGQFSADIGYHPYLDSSPSRNMRTYNARGL